MHLYFIARGIQHEIDLFKTLAQTQFFEWNRKNLTINKDVKNNVQGALRPVQLYEYVFPEEALPEVLEQFNLSDEQLDMNEKLPIKTLRKALKAKPIPRGIQSKGKRMNIRGHNVALHPIGIRADPRGKIKSLDGNEYEQELL